MADRTKSATAGGLGRIAQELPTDRLVSEAQNLLGALGERALSMATDKVGEATARLTDLVDNDGSDGAKAGLRGAKELAEGKSPLKAAVGAGLTGVKEKVKGTLTGGKGGGGGGGKKQLKLTNIVEDVDVGVPLRVAYDQWTQFGDFPGFMKKVETVEQEEDEKLNWKAQVFWSHRSWQATIIEQVPDELILWESSGEKGRVDGAVTFHEITPTLTKILVVLQYHPQGLFERTGNLWRAQGRRVRLELKHFRRHVMTQTILQPDEVEGWRGEIRDGEVVKSHEDALDEEERERDEGGDEDEGGGDEEWDEEGSQEPEDAYDEYEDEEPEEAENEEADEDEEAMDEEADEDEENEEEPYEDEDEDVDEEAEDYEDEYDTDSEDEEDEGDEDEEDEEDGEYEDETPKRHSRRRAPARAR
ncbi:SRPBCC family protein [Embleya sp. NPDC005575]|uniref:SRPBCC family protein n=1 Tax=Embleya sp. NPDC005575 TaxID=3156892 RepID=UPI0033A41C63